MANLMGDAEVELERLYELLEEQTEEFARLSYRAATARAEYKRDWSSAFLVAEGSMDLRRAKADSETWMAYQSKEVSEALEKSQRALIESTREQMGACRTVMASSRV